MKIISLVENTSVRNDIKNEHGLSLYIEASGKKILFDMGQSDALIENAKRLGVDLSLVDIAILSHGHYDHGGGMSGFLEINKIATVYAQDGIYLPYFTGKKYIGITPELEGSDRIQLIKGDFLIGDGLRLVTLPLPPEESGGLTVRQGDRSLPDGFDHEQYLMIEEKERKILISGCSHKGVISISEYFKPDVMIGGFHFMKMPLDESLSKKAKRLDALDCEFYTCHCTGIEQYQFIKKYIKRIVYLSCGSQMEL